MDKTKNAENKGITLIALVITIIVMLILVSVSITMAVKGGLFKYASDAGKKTNEAIQDEQKFATLEEGLSAEQDEQKFATLEEGLSADQLIEKYSGIINAGAVAGNPNKFYGATVTGYTWPNQNNENITWRIFHSDGQNIYLIASDYVKNAPNSANNEICVNKDYRLSMESVINDYIGGEDIALSKAKKWMEDYLDSEYDNMKATAYMLDNSIWDDLYKGTNAEYSIGAPTLKMFTESYNLTHENKIAYGEKNDYGYKVKLGNGKYGYYLEGLDSKNYLYYVTDNAKANNMWLASPSANNHSRVYDVYYDGRLIHNSYSNTNVGFRPVVCLKSDVLLESVTDGEITSYKIK